MEKEKKMKNNYSGRKKTYKCFCCFVSPLPVPLDCIKSSLFFEFVDFNFNFFYFIFFLIFLSTKSTSRKAENNIVINSKSSRMKSIRNYKLGKIVLI